LAVVCLFLLLVEIAAYTRWRLRPQPVRAPQRRQRGKSSKATPAQEPAQPSAGMPQVEQVVAIIVAAAGASLLGASSTFWNRSIQAKMYTLHYFFVVLLFLLAIEYRWAHEQGREQAARRWLVALAAALGLSFTNH